MVSVSNSLGSHAYNRTAQLTERPRPDAARVELKTTRTQDEGVGTARETDTLARTDSVTSSKPASNDDRRSPAPKNDDANQAVTLRAEAQRGSLLDVAV